MASRESVFLLGIVFLAAGCKNEQQSPLYEKVSVERRDLSVTVSAAGTIEPVLTVDVKSKASGEIIEMNVETGDDVQTGRLLARIDPRVQRNMLLQAQANLEVSQARLQNAETQKKRADELFAKQGIAETEHETAILAWATAKADVVRAESDLETARDQMEDTSVKAPIRGTILVKSAELGTVISSPTKDVGGGSVLFRMANLDTMQVRALVDETDIGKIQPGADAVLRVDAYPSRTFRGRVYKIEPQALVQQNVTMFPVIIGLGNPSHLLRPGMNTDVELDVGERQNVLTIPNAALRTPRDVASAAQVLGLDPQQVQTQLAAAQKAAADQASAAHNGDDERTAQAGRTDAAEAVAKAGAGDPVAKTAATTMTLPNGREITLPAGVRAEDVRAAMQKRFSGGDLSPDEQALLRRVFSGMGGGQGATRGGMGGGGGGGGGRGGMRGGRPGAFGGSFIVFALHHGQPEPVEIDTGLTDLDHIEVTRGLAEQDTVLVLPSASLVNGQKEFRDRLQRMQGGGGLPGMQQQQQPPRAASTGR